MFSRLPAIVLAATTLLFSLDVAAQSPIVSPEIATAAVNDSIDMLNLGANAQVISTAYMFYGPSLNSWAVNPNVATERQRDLVYCVALAVLRSEGTLARDWTTRKLSGPEARANLDWAIRAIEGLAMLDLVPERHMAETWARDPALQGAALQLLRRLDSEGRLQSEEQHALLARLERELEGIERT